MDQQDNAEKPATTEEPNLYEDYWVDNQSVAKSPKAQEEKKNPSDPRS